jgi:TP901 family phage tail tape measure protein
MGRAFVEIGADTRKLFAALKNINTRIGKLGSSMAGLGTRMMGVGAAMAAPIALATKQFASFDDAIRLTGAVSGASGAALQLLNDRARELGATTSFTAVQVANLMGELGRAGFKPDEINAMTGAVLDLARATGTDAALSAGIMAATLRQFGMGAEDATRAADVLTATANDTFNSVESLGEALKYAGPVAKSLGMNLEDTAAILGVLGNVGIQGSEAGTALRRLSVISAGAGEKLQELFGISNTDAAGNLKPLVAILDEINTVTANMPVAERTKRMAEAFGLLGITSANVLSQTAGGVTDLAAKLRTAEGTARKTAKEMDAGLGGSFRIALSAIEGTALAIGDALAPSLQKTIDFIGQTAGAITAFVKENQAMVVSITQGIAAFIAAGAALLVIGKTLAVVSGIIAAVTSPIGLIVAGVVALVAAVGSATGVFDQLAGIASQTFGGIYQAIAGGDLVGATEIMWAGIDVAWQQGIASLLSYWHKGVGEIKKTLISIGDAFDANVTKKTKLVGISFAQSAERQQILSSFTGNDAIGKPGDSSSRRQSLTRNVLNSGSAEQFAKRTADLEPILKALDFDAAFYRKTAAENEQSRKNADDAQKEAAAIRQAISLTRANLAQAGIVTEEARIAALEQEKAAIDAATKSAVAAAGVNVPTAQDRLNNLTRGAGLQRGLRGQADSVLEQIGTATTMEALQELAGEFHALAATGKLTEAQLAKFEEVAGTASERLTGTAEVGGAGAAADPDAMRRAAADAAAAQSEVAGTFSSAAVGGMGFGSTLAQQQLDTLKKIEANTNGLGDDGVIA